MPCFLSHVPVEPTAYGIQSYVLDVCFINISAYVTPSQTCNYGLFRSEVGTTLDMVLNEPSSAK